MFQGVQDQRRQVRNLVSQSFKEETQELQEKRKSMNNTSGIDIFWYK